jgi:folate-dependent phosphoribosylglycinamide formyltransferase PurN
MAERYPKKGKVNIFIISIDEPLYVPLFFRQIADKFSDRICGMTVLSPFSNKRVSKGISDTFFGLIKTRLRYYGLSDFIKYCCLYLFYKIKRDSLKILARNHRIKMIPCPKNDVNDEAYIDSLKRLDIDIMICLIPQIAKEGFLKTAKLGCLNTHCSLLPEYKGREPLFWAMLNQDKKVGVTIHLMDKDIDSGPIVKQGLIDVDPADTLHLLYRKATKLGGRLMTEVITDIEKNGLKFIENKTGGSSYCPWPSLKDVAEFRKRGKRFI